MKIAVFWPNWVGDAVMATPAVREIRRHFAGAHLCGVLRPYVAGVLEGLPWHDSLIYLDSNGPWRQLWPAVAARVRKKRIDLAVLFPNSFRSALTAWAGRCRRRVGFARHGRSWLLTDRLAPDRDESGAVRIRPIILDYNRLAMHVGCREPGFEMELATTPRDERQAEAVFSQADFHSEIELICLNPGAAFGAAKFWPVEYFARLAQLLVDRRGSNVLVLCGPNERELASRIVRLAARKQVTSLADSPLSLGLTKACVRHASLLVTTDSGPRHFAAAFDVPAVTLFGPTHIEWTETYHPKAVHLQKRVSCGPCQLRTCPLDHRCMTLLTAEEAYAAAAMLLEKHRKAVWKAAG